MALRPPRPCGCRQPWHVCDQCECYCSLIETCGNCRWAEQHWELEPEVVHHDSARPGGPRTPTPYTNSYDCNPICGHHLRAKCSSCQVCTSCDGCYCGEE